MGSHLNVNLHKSIPIRIRRRAGCFRFKRAQKYHKYASGRRQRVHTHRFFRFLPISCASRDFVSCKLQFRSSVRVKIKNMIYDEVNRAIKSLSFKVFAHFCSRQQNTFNLFTTINFFLQPILAGIQL